MKNLAVILTMGLISFFLSGCFGQKNDDPNALKYGKDVEDIKSYWKDSKGHHFVGIAENQPSLEAGRRLALIMSHRAVSEKIGATLRAETTAKLETSGMNAESAERSFSDIVSQISQNLLSGMTPEKSWHQSAVNSSRKTVYRCFHQVVITDADLNESIERAKQLYADDRERERDAYNSNLWRSKTAPVPTPSKVPPVTPAVPAPGPSISPSTPFGN